MNSCENRNPYNRTNSNHHAVVPSSSSSSSSSFAGPQLSLCFQGVSFSLTPVSSSSTVTLLPNSPMEPLLRLENFTGTLRVSSITPPTIPHHKELPSMVPTPTTNHTVPPALPPMPRTHVTLSNDMKRKDESKKKKRGRPIGSPTKSKKKVRTHTYTYIHTYIYYIPIDSFRIMEFVLFVCIQLSQINHNEKSRASQPMTTQPVMNKVKVRQNYTTTVFDTIPFQFMCLPLILL